MEQASSQPPGQATVETFELAVNNAIDRKARRTIIEITKTRLLIDATDRRRISKPTVEAIGYELRRRQQTKAGRAQQDQAIIDIARENNQPLRLDCLSHGGAFRLLEAMENPEKHDIDPSHVNPKTLEAVRANCKERTRQFEELKNAERNGGKPEKEKKGPRNQKPKRR